ncbi:MAG: hypothetical protein ACRBFS_21430, partial [Aureispira sp.]
FSPWLIPAQSFCTSGSSTLCLTPTNISSSSTANSAQINWMAINNAHGYQIRYRKIGTSALSY